MILGCVHLRWGLPCSLFPTLSSKSMHAWMHLDVSNTWQLIIYTLTSQPLISVRSTATSWSPRFICPACARASTPQHVEKKICSCFRLIWPTNTHKVSPTHSMCAYAKSYHLHIPEAFAGPLGAMPVIKTSPLAVIPIVGGMYVQVSCMYACTRHPDCAHI